MQYQQYQQGYPPQMMPQQPQQQQQYMYAPQQNGATVFQYPMRYLLKQKMFSLTGGMNIQDVSGRDIFNVKGSFFSIGTNMAFIDNFTGLALASIHQVIRLGMPHYEIFRMGQLFAVVKKKFTLLSNKFEIDFQNPQNGNIHVEGDFMAYNFQFTRQGRLVARVTQEFCTFVNSYGVEIQPGEDNIFILACAVIIEKCCHGDEQNNVAPGLGGVVVGGPMMGGPVYGGPMMGGPMMGGPVVEVINPVPIYNPGVMMGPGFGGPIVELGLGGPGFGFREHHMGGPGFGGHHGGFGGPHGGFGGHHGGHH